MLEERFKIHLDSKDKMSGIAGVYYMLNQTKFQEYTEDIGIEEQGSHTLYYYAVDNVGNVESVKKKDFIYDNSPPKTYHNVTGIMDNYIISKSSKIYLSFEDTYSGVQGLYYRIDDGGI